MSISVLYVDDEPDLLELGKLSLEESGNFSVRTINSASSALTLLEEENFDAIISDYQMPNMDGIQFLAEVRSRFGHIPFILFTGRGREELVIQAINNGVDFYLQKGVDQESQFAELSHKTQIAVDRRKNVKKLKDSEERFRLMVDASPDIIWEIDNEGNFTYISSQCYADLGYTPEEMVGKSFFLLIHPESVSTIKIAFSEHIDNKISFNILEVPAIRHDGSNCIIEIRSVPLIGSEGQLRGFQGISRDITRRKQAEEEQKRQSARLSILNEVISTANKADNLDQLFINILEESLLLLDFDAGGIYQVDPSKKNASVVYSKNLHPEFLAEIQTVAIEQKPYDTIFVQNELIITDNYVNFAPERSKKYGFQSMISIPIISKGVTIGAMNIASFRRYSISEEEKQILISIGKELGISIEMMAAEEELKKGLKNFETLFDSIDDMVFVLDMNGCILAANKTVEKRLLYTHEELIGTNVLMLHEPERRDEALHIVQGMITGTINSCPVPVLTKEGKRIEVETKVTRGIWNGQEVLIGVTRDVTERNRVELELISAHESLKETHHLAHIGTFDWAIKTDTVTWSEELFNIIGMDPSLPAPSFAEQSNLYTPSSWEHLNQAVSRTLSTEGPFNIELEIVRPDGSIRFTNTYGDLKHDTNGTVIGFFGTVQDITELKLAEKALKESEEKYRALFDAGSDGIIVIDSETGVIIDCNNSLLQMYGYWKDEIIGKPDTITSAEPDATRASTKEGIHHIPIRYHRRKDGTVFPVEIMSNAITLDGRRVTIGAVRDITERKQTEEALKHANEKFIKVYLASPDSITITDLETGRFTEVNDTTIQMYGYSRDEMIGKGSVELGIWFNNADREDFINQVRTKGRVELYEAIGRRKSGEIFYASISADIIVIDERIHLISVIRDITESKRSEAALKESEERFRISIEKAPEAILLFDVNQDRYIEANARAESLFACNRQQLLDLGPQQFYKSNQPDRRSINETVLEHRNRALTGDVVTFERSIHNNKGKDLEMEVRLVQLGSGDHRLIRSSFVDITERKHAELAIYQANKKITLLYSITRHDINNKLVVIQGYLNILEKKQSDLTSNQYFQKINNAARHISTMINFTKEYETIGVNAPVWQSCHKLVETMANQAQLGDVSVKNDLNHRIEFFADPLIAKVFYNLMDNAVRYGGKISTIHFSSKENGDDYLIVCEDDGEGIPDNEKEMIFERGYGKNTGLGLFLVREILDITRITISETGEPGKGARFEMKVPYGNWRIVNNDN